MRHCQWGELRDDQDALSALLAGLPAGTVSGAPKIRAMQIIDELEKEKRGVYAGGVGYFSAGGDMDTCITLRTAIVKDGTMYIQAGGGVVADSDPELECQESENKAKAMIRAAEEAVRRRGRRRWGFRHPERAAGPVGHDDVGEGSADVQGQRVVGRAHGPPITGSV